MRFDPEHTTFFNINLYLIFGKANKPLIKLMLKHFQDGRHASELMEALIAYKFSDNINKASNCAAYDLISSDNKYFEVKCITHKGLKINPSNQIGVGRKYDGYTAMEYIRAKDGFFHPDITKLKIYEDALDSGNNVFSSYDVPVYFVKQEVDFDKEIVIHNKIFKSHKCAYCANKSFIERKDANLSYKKAIEKIHDILF